jgi:hypothetical protein
MARQRWRRAGVSLLPALIAAGLVLAGVGGLAGHSILFAIGVWLVTRGLMALALLSRAPPG